MRILGDIPFYVARDSADTRSHPELFPRARSPVCRPTTGAPTGSDGATPSTTGRRCGDRLPLVGRAVPPDPGAGRRRPDRSLPGFRRLVVGPRGPSHRPRRADGAAGRAERSSRPSARSSDRFRSSPRTSASSHPRSNGCARSSGCRDASYCSSCSPRTCGIPPRPDDDNVVVYTGTHDNDTTNGWWPRRPSHERRGVERALAAYGIDEPGPVGSSSVSRSRAGPAAIVPAQDLLGLGSGARMNRPGRRTGNWAWRLPEGALTPSSPAVCGPRPRPTSRRR